MRFSILRHSSHARDAALRRLRRCNGWIMAISAGLTGVFTAFAANASIGKTHKSLTGSSVASSSRSPATHRSIVHHAHKHPVHPLVAPSHVPQSPPTPSGGSEAATFQQSAPPPESAPTPSQEAPAPQAAPSQPAPEPETAHEAPAAPESVPEPEVPPASTPPVVSGGS
jgi:hypothetical protein